MSSPRQNLALPSLAALIAEDFGGVHEIGGENKGPGVEFFQRIAGLGSGTPWCACYAWACVEIAAAMKNVPNPLRDVKLKGYVQSYYDWASGQNRIVPASRAGIGDLFLLFFASEGRYAHMGFVERPPLGGGDFVTWEGNSNDDGSRDGYEVVSRHRAITERTVFLRWSEDHNEKD